VSAISHDANGNLIGDGNLTFVYDDNNRLIQVVSPQSVVISQYSYDALGRRISKTVGPDVSVYFYRYDRIIEERDGSNNVQVTYTYGNYIDEVLTKDAGSDRYYYHQNTLWSVHALTDAAGAVVERYTYDAYGQITILDPSFLPLSSAPLAYFTFTGREYDAETGLYHYRARTYGPGLGRFYSRDPLGYMGGISLYEYCRSASINFIDPTGWDPTYYYTATSAEAFKTWYKGLWIEKVGEDAVENTEAIQLALGAAHAAYSNILSAGAEAAVEAAMHIIECHIIALNIASTGGHSGQLDYKLNELSFFEVPMPIHVPIVAGPLPMMEVGLAGVFKWGCMGSGGFNYFFEFNGQVKTAGSCEAGECLSVCP
jgi:RHS repeat-associated protein